MSTSTHERTRTETSRDLYGMSRTLNTPSDEEILHKVVYVQVIHYQYSLFSGVAQVLVVADGGGHASLGE